MRPGRLHAAAKPPQATADHLQPLLDFLQALWLIFQPFTVAQQGTQQLVRFFAKALGPFGHFTSRRIQIRHPREGAGGARQPVGRGRWRIGPLFSPQESKRRRRMLGELLAVTEAFALGAQVIFFAFAQGSRFQLGQIFPPTLAIPPRLLPIALSRGRFALRLAQHHQLPREIRPLIFQSGVAIQQQEVLRRPQERKMLTLAMDIDQRRRDLAQQR